MMILNNEMKVVQLNELTVIEIIKRNVESDIDCLSAHLIEREQNTRYLRDR